MEQVGLSHPIQSKLSSSDFWQMQYSLVDWIPHSFTGSNSFIEASFGVNGFHVYHFPKSSGSRHTLKKRVERSKQVDQAPNLVEYVQREG